MTDRRSPFRTERERRVADDQKTLAPPGWIEATIEFVNADQESIACFVSECIEVGALGAMEGDVSGRVGGEEEKDCKACGILTQVKVYFPESTGIQEVVRLLEGGASAMARDLCCLDARILGCRHIEQEEWATSWKESFLPERVTERFWVVPPWQQPSLPEDAIPIILEPGLAFGTGKHHTTRHCLQFLEEIAGREGGFPESCLDFGCGSGILAIAAQRLGATRVAGLDIDPDALAVARRNLELNRIPKKILLVNGSLECFRGRFELIAANLDATTLLESPGEIWSLMTKGGLLVVSGILDDEKPGVTAPFQKLGFQTIGEKTDREEGWISVLFRKP